MQKENDSFPSGESDVMGASWKLWVPSCLLKHPQICCCLQQLPTFPGTTYLPPFWGPSWKHNKFKLRPRSSICVCWDYFRYPPYHTSLQSLAIASNTSHSTHLLFSFTHVHSTVDFFLPWSNHLYLQNVFTNWFIFLFAQNPFLHNFW